MKNLALALGISLIALTGNAQNEVDALLYTGLEYGGSARFVGMGSSMGALGGDLSVLSTNPAGLGLYRSGEFTLSPTFISSQNKSTYLGTTGEANDFNFAINNIGYAAVYPNESGPWKMVQFGIAMNRLKDFHEDYHIEGTNNENSLLDFISNQATAAGVQTSDLESYDPFYSYPAYQAYLINPYGSGSNILYLDTLGGGADLLQSADIETRGRLVETVIAGSGNYNDRLYIGASLGFQRIVKDELQRYKETVVDSSQSTLNYYQLDQDLEIRGTGFNMRIGAIFRATDAIRIGGAYTSPTWYSMSNTWSTSMVSRFKDGSEYSEVSPVIGLNEYGLKTPSRLLGSLGIVVLKQGLFNIEYEYLDFGGAKFTSSGIDAINFSRENQEISSQYVSVGNVRVGGEYKYKNVSLRAGAGYYPSPYRSGLTESNPEKYMYSGGIGFEQKNWKFDMAYRLTTYSSDYYIYSPDLAQAATLDQNNHSVVLTFGVRF